MQVPLEQVPFCGGLQEPERLRQAQPLAAVHSRQAPEQAPAQQRPPTQALETHSALPPQVSPLDFLLGTQFPAIHMPGSPPTVHVPVRFSQVPAAMLHCLHAPVQLAGQGWMHAPWALQVPLPMQESPGVFWQVPVLQLSH
jgi:hypothetical protein